MQDNLIDQGLNLMLYGMGTVFVFLTILVMATALMSEIVTRLAPPQASPEAKPQPADATTTAGSATIPEQHKRAIEHAIALHRKH